jgi:hypothetical protein
MMTAGAVWIGAISIWLAQDWVRYARIWPRLKQFFFRR